MSRQFQIYVLPTDIDRLFEALNKEVGLQVISPTSNSMEPEQALPVVHGSLLAGNSASSSVDCRIGSLASGGIHMLYSAEQNIWRVDDESEIISVSGCDFDGQTLVRGRFYYQDDFLSGNRLEPKSPEFLCWAEEIFRRAKRHLHRSKELDAYIGEDAERWRLGGGKFASLVLADRRPIYAPSF
jgi:hypothetical protein